MATFAAVCPKCQKVQTYIKPITERDQTPVCCGVPTERQITPPMVIVVGKAAG